MVLIIMPSPHERAVGERVFFIIPFLLYCMAYPDGSSLNIDTDVAVLKSKVEDLEENQVILFDRIRTNEKWIAGAGAVLSVGIAIVSIIAAVNAETVSQIDKIEYESTRMCLSEKGCEDFKES